MPQIHRYCVPAFYPNFNLIYWNIFSLWFVWPLLFLCHVSNVESEPSTPWIQDCINKMFAPILLFSLRFAYSIAKQLCERCWPFSRCINLHILLIASLTFIQWQSRNLVEALVSALFTCRPIIEFDIRLFVLRLKGSINVSRQLTHAYAIKLPTYSSSAPPTALRSFFCLFFRFFYKNSFQEN